jgi:hypothetical protein
MHRRNTHSPTWGYRALLGKGAVRVWLTAKGRLQGCIGSLGWNGHSGLRRRNGARNRKHRENGDARTRMQRASGVRLASGGDGVNQQQQQRNEPPTQCTSMRACCHRLHNGTSDNASGGEVRCRGEDQLKKKKQKQISVDRARVSLLNTVLTTVLTTWKEPKGY